MRHVEVTDTRNVEDLAWRGECGSGQVGAQELRPAKEEHGASVAGPVRSRPAGKRDAEPRTARPRRGIDIRLSRFVRYVHQPAAIGREPGIGFAEPGVGDDLPRAGSLVDGPQITIAFRSWSVHDYGIAVPVRRRFVG